MLCAILFADFSGQDVLLHPRTAINFPSKVWQGDCPADFLMDCTWRDPAPEFFLAGAGRHEGLNQVLVWLSDLR